MATAIKRLGSAAGSGTIGTPGTLVTCPTATAVVMSTLVICNTGASAYTYSVCVSTTTSFVTAGYIVYQASIAAGATVTLTIGMTLDATNKYLLVSSSNAAVVFNAFGTEET